MVLLVVFCGFVIFKMVTRQGAMLGVKNQCGGWSSEGRVECACKGKMEKEVCPAGSECNQGVNTCYGFCGDCNCFDGMGESRPCVTPTISEFSVQ